MIGIDAFRGLTNTFAPSGGLADNLTALRHLGTRRAMLDVMRSTASTLKNDPPTSAPGDLIGPMLGKLTALATPDHQTAGLDDLAAWMADARAGRASPIPLPWPMLTRMSKATLPGSVVVLAADPGAGKSMLTQQAVLHAQAHGIRCASLLLEESRVFWICRALAMLAGSAQAGDAEWHRYHADQAAALVETHLERLNQYGTSITTCPAAGIGLSALATWAESSAAAGARLLVIDPLAVAQPSRPDRLVAETDAMLAGLKRTAQRHAAVAVLVTHPRKGDPKRNGGEPLMDDLAGSSGLQRFADAVLWLKAVDDQEPTAIADADGVVRSTSINRRVKVLKCRNGTASGMSFGLRFVGATLTTEEVGIVLPVARPPGRR